MGSASSKSSAASSSRASSRAPRASPHKYSFIGDNYETVEQVTEALRGAGLESSNLIVGIDFTKSNEWTGRQSFNGRSLHTISSGALNPYEQAIQILGKTLSAFDEDNLIPCFGFGDVHTGDQAVFSFHSDERPCHGFEEVLTQYKEIVPHLNLSGPTSFAPIIQVGMDIVEESGGQYHVLLIIADGQVTQSMDSRRGRLSPQEQATIDAIVEASGYALSIVLVGVGDGPWDTMKQFDDNIPRRVFDNFQFVNFTNLMSRNMASLHKEAAFALEALMEIPAQYKATIELGILNHRTGRVRKGLVRPPPPGVPNVRSTMQVPHLTSSTNSSTIMTSRTEVRSTSDTSSESQICPVCLQEQKDMAFQCGHQTCRDCASNLTSCPICRQQITSRLRLFT